MRLPFTVGNQPIQGNFDALMKAFGGYRFLIGTVNADGTQNTSGPNTSGWSSAQTATGVYTLTFSPAFARIPVLLMTGWTTTEIRHTAMTASGASISAFNSAGAALDSAFDFLALGP